jgi:hypothetical protein
MHQEHQRLTFRRMKSLLGKFRQGVTALEILTDLGWEITTKKEEIETGCIKENIKRFTQAQSTPPMSTDQIQLLGWKANFYNS